MFLRPNFESLRITIDEYSCSSSGDVKPGLKQNLLYLLKRCAKGIKAIKMSDCKDDEATEMENFVQILELWEGYIFGDAQYELNKRLQVNLRRPEKLPNEEDIRAVRDFVVSKMDLLTEDPFLMWKLYLCYPIDR